MQLRLNSLSVVKGLGRGRKLKIPTVNFDPKVSGKLNEGIYICRVLEPINSWGVLHFGPRPTFGEEEKTLEAHLFDFDQATVLPKRMDLEIYDFIRDVIKFESAGEMVERIKEDILFAKERIRVLDEN